MVPNIPLHNSHTLWSVYSTCILPISIAKKDSMRFTLYYPIVQWDAEKVAEAVLLYVFTMAFPASIRNPPEMNLD